MSSSSLGFVQAVPGTFKAILSPTRSAVGFTRGSIINYSLLTPANPRHTAGHLRNEPGFFRSGCHLAPAQVSFHLVPWISLSQAGETAPAITLGHCLSGFTFLFYFIKKKKKRRKNKEKKKSRDKVGERWQKKKKTKLRNHSKMHVQTTDPQPAHIRTCFLFLGWCHTSGNWEEMFLLYTAANSTGSGFPLRLPLCSHLPDPDEPQPRVI